MPVIIVVSDIWMQISQTKGDQVDGLGLHLGGFILNGYMLDAISGVDHLCGLVRTVIVCQSRSFKTILSS